LRFLRKAPAIGVPDSRLADAELKILLIKDADRGWRAFIDQYTPAILSFIERAGIRDRDEAMELYVLVCDRLAADDCARLRRHDPSKGALTAWLATLVRNVTVDWVRTRAGRRRLFGSIKRLPELDQRVFELFYWENRSPAEITSLLEPAFQPLSLTDVLAALDRVQAALTERQRIELVATASRTSTPASLDSPDDEARPYDVADPNADTEGDLRAREATRQLEQALAELSPEDAAIARLKYGAGLSLKQIREALHLEELTNERANMILDALKRRLVAEQGAR
jgi:DNA-directed RNA polymerase specialized sigma24 family protein